MAFLDILNDFAKWSQAHGFGRISGAVNNYWRVFWIVLTVGCIAMLCWMSQMIFAKYIARGVSVTPTFSLKAPSFPAVSITSLNSYLNSMSLSQTVPFGDMDNDYRMRLSMIETGGSSITASSEYMCWGFNETQTAASLKLEARTVLAYAAADVPNRLNYSATYKYSSLITSCYYDGQTCATSDWVRISSSTYGYAYTFNSGGIYNSVRAGPANGLRVMFRTDQYEYQAYAESAGIRIVIHNPDEYEFLTSFGQYASVGVATNLAIKMVTRVRLSSPYGTCITDKGSRSYYPTGGYTVEGCSRSCIQDAVVAACGCAHPLYPSSGSMSKCSYKNRNDYICSTELAKHFNTEKCDCPEECRQNLFTVTVSTANWPAANYIPAQCYKSPLTTIDGIPYWNQGNIADCISWFGNNTGLLAVYFESLDVKFLQESQSYPVLTLVTEFGGLFGLWIGGSVVVIFELIALAILIVLFLVSRCMFYYRKRKNGKVEPTINTGSSPVTDEGSKTGLRDLDQGHVRDIVYPKLSEDATAATTSRM